MQRKFPKSKLICRIDMSCFVGIMMFFVFMFFPQPHGHGGMSVDVPKTSHPVALPHALREDAIMVAISHDGTVFCGSAKTPPDRLHACIRDQVIKGSEPKIYIRADARARYGAVVEVLNAVRESEIEDIAFLAEKWPLPKAQNKVGAASATPE